MKGLSPLKIGFCVAKLLKSKKLPKLDRSLNPFTSAQKRFRVLPAGQRSWNRRIRSGYQVVFVPFRDGMPSGDPVPFLSGLVPNPARKEAYGRIVGVAVAADGSLLISDDGQNLIWRIAFATESSPSILDRCRRTSRSES